MENRNDRKSYYKGLLTGVILCVLIIGVLALSGCFLKDYAPSSTGQTTGTGDAVEASDASSSSGDVTDISGRYKEVEKKLNKLHSVLDQYYLDVSDDSDITQDDMVEGIYKGYVDALNEPYTVYYTKEEYDQLQVLVWLSARIRRQASLPLCVLLRVHRERKPVFSRMIFCIKWRTRK